MLKHNSNLTIPTSPRSRNPKYNSEKAWSLVEGAFSLFDQDSSGCLKKSEFLKLLTQIITDLGGKEPSVEETEDIMWELDKNGDGQISKKEILTLFKTVIEILGTSESLPALIPKGHGVTSNQCVRI